MPQDHDDFAFDHAPGLPAPLPKGEQILWQGRPNAWRLACDSLAIKWIAGYFAFLAVWRVGASLADLAPGLALATAVPLLVLGGVAVAILYGFSWVQARATIYTVTTARVILRVGAALQLTLQIPYSRLANAALDLRADGSGTIAFEPQKDGGARISYLALWPHVRPWHMRLVEPSFRSIPEAERVAALIAEAVEAQASHPRLAPRTAEAPAAPARPVPAGAVPAE